MKKQTKTNEIGAETQKIVTRAEKRDAVKGVIKEILKEGNFKSNELIDEAAKRYADRFKGEENENPNDVKGRVGSVLDVMKKEGEVQFEGGVYATNEEKAEEKPAPKKRTAKKKETVKEEVAEEKAEETPVKKKRASKKKETEAEATVEEKPAPKKRVTKSKKAQEKTAESLENKGEEQVKERVFNEEVEKEEKKIAETLENKGVEAITEKTENLPVSSPKGTLMDMSFLFGEVKPTKAEQKTEQKEEVKNPVPVEKKEPVKTEKKPIQKTEQKKVQTVKKVTRSKTADEKLQEAFLERLHRLSGEYFEYYAVYLLEKYSRKNGRRLEGLKISAGDHDGGIDGEIELTDKLGFRETIYIQAKNWDPSKGDEKLWVVGETLLQQFIGACVCRQAKEGKQNCRGIFITTSRFTPEAKRILSDTSDKFVGYDGADLFETAKECNFGIVKKNGEWALDEQLLAGMKAFFNMA